MFFQTPPKKNAVLGRKLLQKIQNRLVVELILALINLLFEVQETPLLHLRTDNVNLLAIITPETIFPLSLVQKKSSCRVALVLKSVEACFTAPKLQIEIFFLLVQT